MADLPLDSPRVVALKSRLFPWWDDNARDLPWRFGRATPWGILVSEVMSQQTQMSRVAPYWITWMNAWPDARALAKASTAEVITAWGHLGYPRRALRLQECARVVAEQYDNRLPQRYEELIALPGVGDYTASAVLSFAFGTRIAVIDTNIRRVLSRAALGVESLGGAATVADRKLANDLLPRDSKESNVWNQATMELGATVCTAKNPQCEICPLYEKCNFVAAGKPGLAEGRTRPRQHFKGTNRQVRGLILHALRSKTDMEPVRYQELVKLWPKSAQLDECLMSLDADGLIELLPDKAIRFPK
ncbi:MAG: A/G-specific adenine glycosylase [Bifidobacterium sp.]|uniref:Adenine DNA glycosylase n=2 Tax=Bifidobacterium TaxID=1678 RepID=A0AB39UHF0_9BIFI